MTTPPHPQWRADDAYLPHVDGLRAIAVLAVIVYHLHAGWLPGGFIGVDVFFVISGFVVTASLTPHAHEHWRRFIAGFYQRRLTRLVPALLLVLCATTVACLLLIPGSWLSNQTQNVAALAFVGASNWALADQADAYFAPRAEFNPFTHTWSLGVEEQFYLIAPWLIFAAVRFGPRATGVLAALALASAGLATAWTTAQPLQAFYSIASRFWELAAGALWYRLVWSNPPGWARDRRWQGMLAATGLAGLVLCLALASPGAFPMPWALLAVAATLGLIGTPFFRPHWTSFALATRPMLWVGLRSYSLYLWHWPLFVLARWTIGLDSGLARALALGATLALAAASFRWVERPLRRSARWRSLPPAVPVVVLVGLSVLGALVAWQAFEQPSRWSLSRVMRNSGDWYAQHHDPGVEARSSCRSGPHYERLHGATVIEHRPCIEPGAEPGQQLFVLGDSHATGYLPMLHRLSIDEQVTVRVYQFPGCPFLDLRRPLEEFADRQCVEANRATHADVLARARPSDVVFLPSLRLHRFVDQWGQGAEESSVIQVQLGPQAELARRRSIEDARQWLRPFTARGLHVVFEAPKPIFRAPAFRCVDPWTRSNPICRRGLSERVADETVYRASVVQAMTEVAATLPDTSVFDPLPLLCDGTTCHALRADGRPLYFDADHLSRLGNEIVYPGFRAHYQRHAGRRAADATLPP